MGEGAIDRPGVEDEGDEVDDEYDVELSCRIFLPLGMY
jgi:hypothetical protein